MKYDNQVSFLMRKQRVCLVPTMTSPSLASPCATNEKLTQAAEPFWRYHTGKGNLACTDSKMIQQKNQTLKFAWNPRLAR